MTAAGATPLRTLAFGDVDGDIWGTALGTATPIALFGDPAGNSASSLIEGGWSADGPNWRLVGDGVTLDVTAGGEEAPPPQTASPEAVSGFQELCRVRGTLSLSGSARAVDCVGTRCSIDGVDINSLGSARAVSAWFADDEALTVLALRRSGATEQESDLIAATLFDPEGWVPVQDPRLSTTYSGSGAPARCSLELWVGEGENEFPRRAAGEAAGAAAVRHNPDVELRATPLRCHSRGREGSGIYLLATF
ncbi:MAG: hypothetical protein WAL63_05935 [Solirubrobacteraceae bacterium]